MSSPRSSTDQHGTAKDSKNRVISGKARELAASARKRTMANTGMQEGAEPEVKLESDQPIHQEVDLAPSPALPVARSRAPRAPSSSPDPEDVEVGYLITDRKRRKKADDSTPADASPQPAAAPTRLGGPWTPSSRAARPDVDRHTACYLQVLRDLDVSDETFAGAITDLVKAKLKDEIISSDQAITSKVPQILTQLRQHGVSAAKCEEVTERLQRAEARQLARRIAGLFADHDVLEMVSDALCAEMEKDLPVTTRAKTAAPGLDHTASRASLTPRTS